MTRTRSSSRIIGALSLDLAEVWRVERARARGLRQREMVDRIDELRAAGQIVAVGVRMSNPSGDLCVVWAAAEHVESRRGESS